MVTILKPATLFLHSGLTKLFLWAENGSQEALKRPASSSDVGSFAFGV